MAKPPAFSFYASDFLVDTFTWPEHMVGAWVRLLAYWWVNGPSTYEDAARVSKNAKEVLKLAQRKLIEYDDGTISSRRLESERTKKIKHFEKQAINGRKGGRPRKPNNTETEPNDNTETTQTETQKKPKENPTLSKTKTQVEPKKKPLENEKEKEIEESIDRIILHLNKVANKSFNQDREANRGHIRARLKEGFTEDQCKQVADVQTELSKQFRQGGESKFDRQWLNPTTLYRPKNFEKYHNNALDHETRNNTSNSSGFGQSELDTYSRVVEQLDGRPLCG